ncbi:MAG: inositol monophosphatase [Rhodovulum sulfidophilum]|uniref:Inositol monophosphatase n=1 Tax=Rhodovulum sulfidophilum TaxID=35806 RepID=A0A2W5NG76_RHOSU|nr:MAG: inositol monophosphatase [Rhodovulum sulfidophilum]
MDEALTERYAQAREIGARAGALARVYWQSRADLVVESKASLQDIVSEADRSVERQIRDEVARDFPGDGFIGEEYGFTPGTSGFTWVIDPIDGTSPYLHGMPSWCTAICVLRDGAPVIGVIAVPTHGEDFAAVAGGGALLNGAPLVIPDDVTLRNATTGVGASQYSEPARTAEIVRGLTAAGGVLFNNGSGALMLAYVAAGRLAGIVSEYMNAWDCLAGLLIVREAGGRTAKFRADGDFSKPDRVIAAAPGAWDDVAALMGLG